MPVSFRASDRTPPRRQIGLHSACVAALVFLWISASVHGEIDVSGVPGFETGVPARGIHVPNPREDLEFDPNRDVESGREDLLVFKNGDRLGGWLERIDNDGGLVWRYPGASSPIVFSVSAQTLARLHLARKWSASPKTPSYRVYLANGDNLLADSLGFRDGRFTFETSFAGVLSAERKHILRVVAEPAEGLLYAGPDGLGDWKIRGDGGNWRYRDGEFQAVGSGTIASEFELPSAGRIEFSVSSHKQLNFTLSILGGNFQHYGNGGYAFRFRRNRADLYRYSQSSGKKRGSMRSAENLPLHEEGEEHIGVFFDVEQGRIGLLVNGELVSEWTEEDGKLGNDGNVVLFQSHGNTPFTISGIQIGAWCGRYPAHSEMEGDEDALRLTNGDIVTGGIGCIEANKVSVKTAYAELSIPMEQIAEMTFSSVTREPSEGGGDSMVASLGPAGKITLQLNAMDAETLKGSSRVFGDLQINSQAVHSLVWAAVPKTDEPL